MHDQMYLIQSGYLTPFINKYFNHIFTISIDFLIQIIPSTLELPCSLNSKVPFGKISISKYEGSWEKNSN